MALPVPESAAYGGGRFGFGIQLDAHPLTNGDGGRLTDDAVAAYVAKYTSKSVEAAGAVDRRIDSLAEIRALRVSPHVRALIATAWRLGALPELQHLRLRAWAHMLGYRGHCLTKTRAYSTTYGQLREARADHARGLYADWDTETVTDSAWRFAGTGHTAAEALIAAGVAEDLATNRELAREDADGADWSRGEQVTAQRAGVGRLSDPRAVAPAPTRRQALRAPIIESEIVIVDDEGREEPYDSAKH